MKNYEFMANTKWYLEKSNPFKTLILTEAEGINSHTHGSEWRYLDTKEAFMNELAKRLEKYPIISDPRNVTMVFVLKDGNEITIPYEPWEALMTEYVVKTTLDKVGLNLTDEDIDTIQVWYGNPTPEVDEDSNPINEDEVVCLYILIRETEEGQLEATYVERTNYGLYLDEDTGEYYLSGGGVCICSEYLEEDPWMGSWVGSLESSHDEVE